MTWRDGKGREVGRRFRIGKTCMPVVNSCWCVAAAAKSLQLCPTLCDPIDGRPSGSPVPGILQARTLEWVAISFSNAWKWKVEVKSLSHVQLFATPWTAAYQAPPSMGFSWQEYWSGVPSLSLWCVAEPIQYCNVKKKYIHFIKYSLNSLTQTFLWSMFFLSFSLTNSTSYHFKFELKYLQTWSFGQTSASLTMLPNLIVFLPYVVKKSPITYHM